MVVSSENWGMGGGYQFQVWEHLRKLLYGTQTFWKHPQSCLSMLILNPVELIMIIHHSVYHTCSVVPSQRDSSALCGLMCVD